MNNFHYVARAILRRDDHVLLVRDIGADYHFLPGGHVEHGEPAKEALRRELREELAVDSTIFGFRGAIENCWLQDGELHCEIGLVFDAKLSNTDENAGLTSQEPHLEFEWVAMDQLEKVNLLPTPVIGLIRGENTTGWMSTY